MKTRMFVHAGLMLVSGLVLTGCAGIPSRLKPEQVAEVNRTHVRAYLPQNQLRAEFIQSNYGGSFGLIGAIVDGAVTAGNQRNADERVQQLREQIRDVDVRAMYWQSLSNQVCGVPWLKIDKFDTIPDNVRALKASDVEGGAAMIMGSGYSISQNCRVFEFTTGVDLYLPHKHQQPSASVLMTYHSSEYGKTNGVEAIKLWSANGAAPLRKAISEAIEGSVRMVRLALECMGNASETPERPAKVAAVFIHAVGDFGSQFGKESYKVMVLEDTPERLIFRSPNGRLWSFPRQEVEVKYLPTK